MGHQGARPDRFTTVSRQLTQSFFVATADTPKTSLDELHKVEQHLNQGKPLENWLGIRVYEPEQVQNEGRADVIWRLTPEAPERLKKVITIGVFEGHAFLIKDIEKLAKNVMCSHFRSRFTKAANLQRHNEICSKGETKVVCKNQQVEPPRTAFEQAFFPDKKASAGAILWLENESKTRGIHIHHARCGHGGERFIGNGAADGIHLPSKTVFQFHGCFFHGCPKCYPDREQFLAGGKKAKVLFEATKKRKAAVQREGYRVTEMWACDYARNPPKPIAFAKTYPHAILYDFEAIGDKTQHKEPTNFFSFENAHVPISVSIGDTLEPTPTFLCDKDPKELCRKFMEELERRGENIRTQVRRTLFIKDFCLLPKPRQQKINEWRDQVPVLGFNSGHYDLNMIKEHFVEQIAEKQGNIKVAKNAKKIMFMSTTEFKFLDLINYLGPATIYDKWVKAYGCSTTKSWLRYEWFDTPDNLDFPALPDYPTWYSRLKNEFVLTLTEWKQCGQLFKEKGMQTFRVWLRHYNNLDVAAGLEAMVKMRDFYTEKGIDLFKDAVSIPGLSMHYLLRGSIERGAELWAPNKEEYDMLKGAVVGGRSLVFTRYHEAGVTRIRSHQIEKPKLCHKILGYDANAFYLLTMAKDMPCGKGEVVHYTDAAAEVPAFTNRMMKGELLGYAEVDIEIPRRLWPKFEEMPPFFINKEVPDEAIPQHIFYYLQKTGRSNTKCKKLVGALSAEKMLVYAPLLRWYVVHGAEIKAVHRTIDYTPKKIFNWFVQQVTEARRTGDVEKEKALLADAFKLLGNSAYVKMIEAVKRHTNVVFTKYERVADRALRSAFFSDLNEIGEVYELESRKRKVEINRPFQVGIAVYQLAKLRMLEFYYDFLDWFVDRSDFELIQMDTDSNYLTISGERGGQTGDAGSVRGVKKEVAGLGQVEQPRTGALQARVRGPAHDCSLLEVLLRQGKQTQHKGDVQSAECGDMGALQSGAARRQRHASE